MFGQSSELVGGDAETFGGVFANFGDDLVVEEGDDLPELLFNARSCLVDGLVNLAAEVFKAATRLIGHTPSQSRSGTVSAGHKCEINRRLAGGAGGVNGFLQLIR